MSEKAFSMNEVLPIVVIAVIVSLVITLPLVYFATSIFPPLGTKNLVDKAITTAKIEDSAIVTAKLADGSVTSAKILDGTVTGLDLMDGSIVTVKVADDAVTTSKIADNAITTLKVADNAIVTAKLADGVVTSAKILDGAVTTQDMADGSIVNIKVADGAITASKIADGAVTTGKLADYAVSDIKLGSAAIPLNYTWNDGGAGTFSTSWVDMPDMSVTLTLARKSHMIIMFSANAYLASGGSSLNMRVQVDGGTIYPIVVGLTRETYATSGTSSFIYNLPDVDAGVHTVQVQWVTPSGTQGIVYERTLTVFALPT
jgi:hypothetical protein